MVEVQKTGLTIYLLGGFRLTINGEDVHPDKWRLRASRNLVKLLALTPSHRLHREQLMDWLWPDADPELAANNLHQALYVARRGLVPGGKDTRYLVMESEWLILDTENKTWIDLDVFEEAARKAQCGGDISDYQAAVAAYIGELLPEDRFETWIVHRREGLQQVYIDLLKELAQLHERRNAYEQAIQALKKLVELEPTHEDAHVGLMRLYALNGSRQQALHQYQLLEEILHRDLEVEPDKNSQRLYKEILAGEFTPSGREYKNLDMPDRPHHNLPAPITSFIGREKEVQKVKECLSGARLVTLVGVGGIGKTRLSLRVAEEIIDDYPDGVYFIELASLQDPALIEQTMAMVLGLHIENGLTVAGILHSFLRQKQLFLILDNCEHLVVRTAQVIQEVLHVAPNVKVMATTREALGLLGEVVFQVPSMNISGLKDILPFDEFLQHDAVKLFIDRAKAVMPALTILPTDTFSITQICNHLDGIPLAIEMAAARVNILSVDQIASRLGSRFNLLTSGNRMALPRQQTLKASIEWSYELLSSSEKKMLRQLSVFTSGWSLDSVVAICNDAADSEIGILDLLAGLINKSLVKTDIDFGEVRRYSMLETIRLYAHEQLENAGELASMRNQHLAFFTSLAESLFTQLFSPTYVNALKQYNIEMGNLRAALRWSLEACESAAFLYGVRLISSMIWYFINNGFGVEGYQWVNKFEVALLTQGVIDDETRIRIHFMDSVLKEVFVPGFDFVPFEPQCADLLRNYQNRVLLALAWFLQEKRITNRGKTSVISGEDTLSSTLNEISSSIIKESQDPWLLAISYELLAETEFNVKKNVDLAREFFNKSYMNYIQSGDKFSSYFIEGELAYLELFQGNYDTVSKLLSELLPRMEELHLINHRVDFYYYLGCVYFQQNLYTNMEQIFMKAINLGFEVGNEGIACFSLRCAGIAVLHQRQTKRAKQILMDSSDRIHSVYGYDPYGDLVLVLLMAIAEEMSGSILLAARLSGAFDARLPTFFKPLDIIDQMVYDRFLPVLQSHLNDPQVQDAYEAGKQLTVEQAIEEIRSLLAKC